MFIRYSTELPLPAPQVEQALLQQPTAWLPGLACGAQDRADHLLTEVGTALGSRRVTRRVEVELGEPLRVAAGLVVPLRWHAAQTAGLYPQLDGDLEVAPVGPGRTRLGLAGQYAPPLGAVGRTIDRLVLHRVAEATARDFLDQVAARLAATANHPTAAARPRAD